MLLVLQNFISLSGNPFIDRLNEGGPLFMYTTLFILIVIIALLIRGFIKPTTRNKTVTLVSSISLFVLVWGFLGQMIGFIEAFDAISVAGDISPAMLAGGIKVSILSPLFGMVAFLIARIGIIILNILNK
ncbi:MAG: MotA/TolQ/ExbB proton channel family protein [Lutibacter sp.]|uniref:MotA/TolQ/ExbB proton channel family protein n=1 Tax=Lutibacter sp. TaxID=1925666 RepID=UPI00182F2C73|nr:MotA/TolQ/ExbB proton channel family protein [Lutibacter sp.]MBT8316934.1 MotA/TolQ/ExbB proton channel family protein [Lutibacter sp.]NNJ57794.1 MotA/TolQ/ExbB proton channel family protein [Lutibacter sp.]